MAMRPVPILTPSASIPIGASRSRDGSRRCCGSIGEEMGQLDEDDALLQGPRPGDNMPILHKIGPAQFRRPEALAPSKRLNSHTPSPISQWSPLDAADYAHGGKGRQKDNQVLGHLSP